MGGASRAPCGGRRGGLGEVPPLQAFMSPPRKRSGEAGGGGAGVPEGSAPSPRRRSAFGFNFLRGHLRVPFQGEPGQQTC